MSIYRIGLFLVGPLVTVSAAPLGAAEPSFPIKPVRWVVPFPPGGSIDVVSRVITARLSQTWGAQCIVDNRLGAGGRVGVQAVVNAPPDGYDPEKALVPVTIVASTSQLLISTLSFPPKSVKELIVLARARPNEINYGSSGAGGSLHLAMELLKSMTGIQMTHIVYKGGGPAATDLIAGQIQVMFFNTPAATPFLKAGKVRSMGISTAKRSPLLPDVPTLAETGVPGFHTDVWFGLTLPAGTNPSIINKMHRDITKVLEDADVRKHLASIGADALNVTPDEMAKRIRTETVTWAKVIQGSSIKFE
jgi:tripartite-type tricarboxylate transporter receptor subunit TctC